MTQPNDPSDKTQPEEGSKPWNLAGALFYGLLLKINVIWHQDIPNFTDQQ